MDKTLTHCKDCAFWHRGVHTKYDGYIDFEGVCNRPYEATVIRQPDDFCSRGRPRNEKEDKQ